MWCFFSLLFSISIFYFKDKILNRPHIRAFDLVLFCIHVANLFVHYMILFLLYDNTVINFVYIWSSQSFCVYCMFYNKQI